MPHSRNKQEVRLEMPRSREGRNSHKLLSERDGDHKAALGSGNTLHFRSPGIPAAFKGLSGVVVVAHNGFKWMAAHSAGKRQS